MTTLEAITNNVRSKYPHLLEDGISIIDYYFWDCTKNTPIPTTDIKIAKEIITASKIKDVSLVIYFSNDIIGYRLEI